MYLPTARNLRLHFTFWNPKESGAYLWIHTYAVQPEGSFHHIMINNLLFSKLVDLVLGLFAKMWHTLLREQ